MSSNNVFYLFMYLQNCGFKDLNSLFLKSRKFKVKGKEILKSEAYFKILFTYEMFAGD